MWSSVCLIVHFRKRSLEIKNNENSSLCWHLFQNLTGDLIHNLYQHLIKPSFAIALLHISYLF